MSSAVKKAGVGAVLVCVGLLVYYVAFSLHKSTYLVPTTDVVNTVSECFCPQTQCVDPSRNASDVTPSASLQDTEAGETCNCDGTAQRFPQAIIIGVRKGGTRALIDMLGIHPNIATARGEIHYFDRDENFSKGVQWYIERMPQTTPGQITVEKSPSYFIAADVPMRLSMVSKNVKILLIVRDPIERAISDFAQLDSRKQKKDSSRHTFEELAIRSDGEEVNEDYSPIIVSTYDVHYKRWLKYFDQRQIHIVNGDALIRNPFPELQNVETFLGLHSFYRQDMFFFNEEKGFYCWKKRSKKGVETPFCLGSGKGREHPVISESAHSKLKAFFKPHNEAFYTLTGQNFGW